VAGQPKDAAGHPPGEERGERDGYEPQPQPDPVLDVHFAGGEVEEDDRRQQHVEDQQQRAPRREPGGSGTAPLRDDPE